MKFLTNAQVNRLITNGLAQIQARGEGQGGIDFKPVVKFFTPDMKATWLLTEIDPDFPTHAFGLGDLGVGCAELGIIDLKALETFRGILDLPVERDLHFTPDRTLSEYAEAARLAGRIVT